MNNKLYALAAGWRDEANTLLLTKNEDPEDDAGVRALKDAQNCNFAVAMLDCAVALEQFLDSQTVPKLWTPTLKMD